MMADREQKHVSALVRAGDHRRVNTAAVRIQRTWRRYQQRKMQSEYMHQQRGWLRERQQMSAEQHRAAAQTGQALVRSTVKRVEVRSGRQHAIGLMTVLAGGSVLIAHASVWAICACCLGVERGCAALQETMNLLLMEMLLPKKVKQKVYEAQVQAGLQPRGGMAGSKTAELVSPRVPAITPPSSHSTTRKLAALLPGRTPTVNGHTL